jgi:outer membrane biosynthesis protein TonB
MGRLSASVLALAVGAVAALALASCGSGGGADLLPGHTASQITSNLDQVKQLANEGECIGAEDAAQEVSAQVEALGGIDKQLKQVLREGAARLNEVVESCQEAAPEETEAIETAEEPAAVEKNEKPAKPEKTEKPKKEAEEPAEETTPALPPQAEGKAKGHEEGEEEAAPIEPSGGTPSGGVGPGAPAGGE